MEDHGQPVFHPVTIAHFAPEIKLTSDLYLKVGQLLQSVDDLRDDLAENKSESKELRAENKELRALLIALTPKIEQAAKSGADWDKTKKKGILWLAGIGASGLTVGTFGGKPFLGWLGSLLPLLPK